MKLKKVGKDDILAFHGIGIEREYRDGNLFGVTIRFEDGNFFTVAKDGWSDLSLLIKEPAKKVKKYRVHGEFHDKPFESILDTKSAAEELSNISCDLEIEEIEVEEE